MISLLKGPSRIDERKKVSRVILRNIARTCSLVFAEMEASKVASLDAAKRKVGHTRTNDSEVRLRLSLYM